MTSSISPEPEPAARDFFFCSRFPLRTSSSSRSPSTMEGREGQVGEKRGETREGQVGEKRGERDRLERRGERGGPQTRGLRGEDRGLRGEDAEKTQKTKGQD